MRTIFNRTLGLVMFLALMSSPAAAAPITITFSGTGAVTPAGPPDSLGNLLLLVFGPTTSYDFGDGTVWQVESTHTANLFTGLGLGTFEFSNGVDSLAGTFTTQGNPAIGQFLLTYLVTGGGGVYTGFGGTGSSVVQLLGDPNSPPTPYSEAGVLAIAEVPEPGSLVLLGTGLAAWGSRAWSRRKSGARS